MTYRVTVDKYAWKPLGCAGGEEGGRSTPRYVLTGKRKGQLHAKDDWRRRKERQHGNENRTRSEPRRGLFILVNTTQRTRHRFKTSEAQFSFNTLR